MKSFVNVFLFLILWISVCCEEQDEIKKVQIRGLYNGGLSYANDFQFPSRPGGFSYLGPPGHHHHHHTHHYHSFEGSEVLEDSNTNSSLIPLDFVMSISDYSVNDLLLNVIDDGPVDEHKPSLILTRFGGSDSNGTERNGAQFARPAKCIPELQTVRIIESKDPNVFYVPECTRVERCGGCCSHVLLACQPIETETVTFTIMKTEYTGNRRLKYIGKEPVFVERHRKCKCGCKIKAEDCTEYQEYNESECRCVCKNIDEEKKCYSNGYKKLWNPDQCACQCREVVPCSTGFQFDYNECRCIQNLLKRRYVLTGSRKEQPQDPAQENN